MTKFELNIDLEKHHAPDGPFVVDCDRYVPLRFGDWYWFPGQYGPPLIVYPPGPCQITSERVGEMGIRLRKLDQPPDPEGKRIVGFHTPELAQHTGFIDRSTGRPVNCGPRDVRPAVYLGGDTRRWCFVEAEKPQPRPWTSATMPKGEVWLRRKDWATESRTNRITITPQAAKIDIHLVEYAVLATSWLWSPDGDDPWRPCVEGSETP